MPPVLSKPTTRSKEKAKLMNKFGDAWKMDQDAQYTLEQKRFLIRLSRTVMMYSKGRDLIGEVLRKVPVQIDTDLAELRREYEKLVDQCLEENIELDVGHILKKVENVKQHVWDRRYREEVKMYTEHLFHCQDHLLPPLTTSKPDFSK